MSNIIFMGSPAFAVSSLAALAGAGHQIIGVYTQPDRPAGRGRKLTPPPVKVWAQAHGLPVFQPPSLHTPEALAELRRLAPQAMAIAAYGKLLPETVLAVPPKGVLNVHPSLLPKYRGPLPSQSGRLGGDAVTGVSIMLVDAGMDSGPVLAQTSRPIAVTDTAEGLEHELADEGGRLLVETLARWLRGEVTPAPQDETEATFSRKLEKEDGEIIWSGAAADIERRIRALNPWPGCYTTWRGATLKVLKAYALPGRGGVPGAVVALGAGRTAVATGDGVLALEVVQPEGKQQMTARELVAGRHDFVGSRLGEKKG